MLLKILPILIPLLGLVLFSCGQTCPPGEEYTTCGSLCPRSCSSDPNRMCAALCVKGCFCPPDKVKNSEGKCIYPEECPGAKKCRCDEIYTECGTACPPTCSKPNPKVCTEQCVSGCFCPNGTLRDNSTNRCVLPEECDTCPKGETFNKSGTACPPTCGDPDPKGCEKRYAPGCFCPDDKVRDENSGSCVDLKDCNKCLPGEVYNNCSSSCPQTCQPSKILRPCIEECVESCSCPDGQIKDLLSNKCVCPRDCSKCPDGEEFLTCGTACPLTCNNPKERPCTKNCVTGCFCPPGLLRDEITGKCVDPAECTACPVGEHYDRCGAGCQPTCNNPKPEICPAICVSGCVCDNGTIRDQSNNKCVAQGECTCKEKEVYNKCGTACPRTCKDPNPKICTLQCVEGCFCQEGLVKNTDTGECVPTEECPESKKCRCDEVYEKCGTSCPPTCSEPNPEVCTDQCVSGCFCPNGTLRDNSTDRCVLPEECDTCPKGETFNKSGTACPPTCGDPDPKGCEKRYAPGCFCPDDKVRDENSGSCVDLKDCNKCLPGEVYSNCSSSCTETCQQSKILRSCVQKCVEGCSCPEGQIRDILSNKCVCPRDCFKCPEGEQFLACGTACPLTCNNPKKRLCTKNCVTGCFCPPGLLRDEITGKCVESAKCTACPVGEHYDRCGAGCQPTCNNPKPEICPAICVSGCVCDNGTIRDQSNNKCVAQGECTCKEKEVYNKCGTACPRTCKDPNPKICTLQCVEECFCQKDLVKDTETDECVPVEECPQTEPTTSESNV